MSWRESMTSSRSVAAAIEGYANERIAELTRKIVALYTPAELVQEYQARIAELEYLKAASGRMARSNNEQEGKR